MQMKLIFIKCQQDVRTFKITDNISVDIRHQNCWGFTVNYNT
mgnify:CR=1 FL=1